MDEQIERYEGPFEANKEIVNGKLDVRSFDVSATNIKIEIEGPGGGWFLRWGRWWNIGATVSETVGMLEWLMLAALKRYMNEPNGNARLMEERLTPREELGELIEVLCQCLVGGIDAHGHLYLEPEQTGRLEMLVSRILKCIASSETGNGDGYEKSNFESASNAKRGS